MTEPWQEPSSAPHYRIIDKFCVQRDLNQYNYISWPSEELRRKAGKDAWGAYKPSNGEVGILVLRAPHIHSNGETLILKIDGHYVPILARGAKLVNEPLTVFNCNEMWYQISNYEKVEPTANKDELAYTKWPSEEIRQLAGQDAWDDFRPSNGDRGYVAGSSAVPAPIRKKIWEHRRPTLTVLKIGSFYVPVRQDGISTVAPPAPLSIPPHPRTDAMEAHFGKLYMIADSGKIYTTINKGRDWLNWPSEKVRLKAGDSGWQGYRPKNGDVGVLIASSRHCSQPNVCVYILKVGRHYVPITGTATEEIRCTKIL